MTWTEIAEILSAKCLCERDELCCYCNPYHGEWKDSRMHKCGHCRMLDRENLVFRKKTKAGKPY